MKWSEGIAQWLIGGLILGFAVTALAQTCNLAIPESTPTAEFTDHGDGTVTHTRTGLMWKRCAEGQAWSGSTCTGTASTATWASALTAAVSATTAGHSDWRLPSIKELESILEEKCYNPWINATVFPNTSASKFWSASADAGDSDYAWYVDFYYGGIGYIWKVNDFQVRLVRAGQSFGSFDRLDPIKVAVTPSGIPAAEYTFTATLSAPLSAGQSVFLNFDDQQGHWYAEGQDGGHVPMSCSGTVCQVNRHLVIPGLRSFRAGVFDASDQLVGSYSASQTCTLDQCLAAVLHTNDFGNPALSGSGSQLVRGVDVANGNYHLSVSDLAVAGKGPDFVAMRAYNSRSGLWTFNLDATAAFVDVYNRQIAIGPREDGRMQYFYKDMDQLWYALNPGNFDRLVEEADGSFTLYTQGNLFYRFAGPGAAEAGRLQSINDRDSQALTFSHTANRITGATDASGRNYTVTRDGGGRITRVTDFTGRYVDYTWTANGIVAARNPRGLSTTYGYDGTQLTSITDPRNNVQATIAYVASGVNSGRVESVTDGAGNVWTYSYTGVVDAQNRHGTGISRPATNGVNNNLLFVIDAARTRVEERVDSVSAGDFRRKNQFRTTTKRTRIAEMALVARSERPSGAATEIGYEDDGTGNPRTINAKATGMTDLVTAAAWGSVANQVNLTPLVSVQKPGVSTTTRYSSFTPSGKPTTIINALDQTSSRSYTSGRLMQSTDARGNSTSITYDAQGRPTRVTDALGNYTETTYDVAGLGRVVAERNARGGITHYTHDANGNILTITDPAGGVTTHTYDDSDNLVSTIDARGNTTTYVYDSLNRKTEERYTVGGVQRTRGFAYDAMGRLSRVTNEKGNASETRFDARGKTLQEIDPLSHTVSYTYDANGNVLTVTDAANRRITYTYDGFDRKTRATDANNNYEEYGYNAQGLLASKRDARGQVTQYEYDALGRMTRVIDADSGVTTASYDANGNLIATTDRKSQTVNYSYDAVNRMTRLTDAMGRQWNFTFDANGNLLTRTTPAGQATSYTYDAVDRVSSIAYPGGPTVSFTYDANGNRLTMADGNGTTNYSYDEQNRLTSVVDAFGNSVAWRYDAAGLMDRLTYPGNRNVSYAYDAAGRLLGLTDWLNHTTSYTRDNSGAVTAIQYGNGAKVQKTYDAAGRLVTLVNRNAANAVISSHSLTLDGAGNPVSAALDLPLLPTNAGQTAAMLYDASNRMGSIGGKTLTHDSDGRLTSDASGADPIQYAYNAQDLITGVTKASVLTDSYGYDGDGRRVRRTSGGQTTRYVLDPTGGDLYRLLAETDGSNAVQHYYLYGDGGLVSQISGNSHRYYHYDQTGNTLALTDSGGAVTDTYAYEPFGNTTVQGSSYNPFRFVGQYGVMDDGNGLNHMRARYYRPDLRRFVSLDALYGEVTDPMALNRYQYVSGNPMVGVDPSGNWTEISVKAFDTYLAEQPLGTGKFAQFKRWAYWKGVRQTLRERDEKLSDAMDAMVRSMNNIVIFLAGKGMLTANPITMDLITSTPYFNKGLEELSGVGFQRRCADAGEDICGN